jgi:hypothetical protein
MKKIISFLITLTLIDQAVFAQNEEVESSSGEIGIKWAPASIFFGKISLSGEYSISDKQSITLGVGIPFDNKVTQEFDDEEESITWNTFSIMGGYRFYLGKGAGKGLYFEPYVKYLKHEAHSIIDGDVGGTNRQFEFTSDYSGIGVGAQLGVQFVVAKNLLIDFFFLGPEANSSKHTTFSQEIGGGAAWDAQDAQDAEDEIRDFFSDVPLLKDKLEITANAAERSVSTNYKGFLPGIRFGVSIGFRF